MTSAYIVPGNRLLSYRQYTFLLVVLIATASTLSAQTNSMRPMARMIVSPTADVTASRPRIVGITANLAGISSPSFEEANAAERNAFEKTNLARVNNGLQPLTWDPELCRFARAHSEEMAQLGYFAHETPEGLQLKDRAKAMRLGHFRVIGENIAYNKGYEDPGGFAVERWMTSGGHRANILYVGFQSSAIGTYVSSDGSVYITQVFITR